MAIAVSLGAFGAHALKGKIADIDLNIFQTANQYQIMHSFGLLILGALTKRVSSKALRLSGYFMGVGIFLFSGSLYALALSNFILHERLSFLGMITPLGGISFILAWLTIPTYLWRGKSDENKSHKNDKE
ncbi:MAG: DUF423 domain-containing protein [Bacteroidetes bacterium]|nr:DUF423 domain-containing protein [Bacteroidota bacterium]